MRAPRIRGPRSRLACPRRARPCQGMARGRRGCRAEDRIFYVIRVAAWELGAFLELRAPAGGHDAAALAEEHADRFAADQRRRARDRLPSLRAGDGTRALVVTEVTSKATPDALRKIMRWALETDQADRIGLDRAFARGFPQGGKPAFRPRSPFTDQTARALADPVNLGLLAGADPSDRGARDIWENDHRHRPAGRGGHRAAAGLRRPAQRGAAALA